MRFLIDTNVVLRLSDRSHGMHGEARAATAWLDTNGHDCVIVPQVLYEYWVVATRPLANNGLGMTVADADAAISRWMVVFRLLLDERGIFAFSMQSIQRIRSSSLRLCSMDVGNSSRRG